jgi:hypothetical protein
MGNKQNKKLGLFMQKVQNKTSNNDNNNNNNNDNNEIDNANIIYHTLINKAGLTAGVSVSQVAIVS